MLWLAAAIAIRDDVVGDGEEPTAKRGMAIVRKSRQGFGEDEACRILGCLTATQATVAVAMHRIEVASIEERKMARVLHRQRNELGVGGVWLRHELAGVLAL